ncbi:hypothetical protein [Luteolibacter pohnpeiensis]|uniref:hypothetical protein n=1 Tax=Luteolibacter pohnpeiensis TaxID=454153 RepID=UPI001F400057|nr:hypothetical protein [Luteolibacter pohnpeiensis]
MKRLNRIAADHLQSAARMGVKPEDLSFQLVIDWLRQHAEGKNPTLRSCGDEILDYLHQALIDDLLLEPANILLATRTGRDSIRYDAMDPAFWLECLDLFETALSESQ